MWSGKMNHCGFQAKETLFRLTLWFRFWQKQVWKSDWWWRNYCTLCKHMTLTDIIHQEGIPLPEGISCWIINFFVWFLITTHVLSLISSELQSNRCEKRNRSATGQIRSSCVMTTELPVCLSISTSVSSVGAPSRSFSVRRLPQAFSNLEIK